MTNREWLESLSDEDYAKVVTAKVIKLHYHYGDYLFTLLEDFEKWLQAEHKEENDDKT